MTNTDATERAGGVREAVKPFDLRNLLRDAFLSGRGLKGDEYLSDEDQAAWVAYEPGPKNVFERVNAALSPPVAPAPAVDSGAVDEGQAKGWAAVYDGQIKSCHRSRETCVADAEHYQAIHPVYLGPAWRHQED